MLIEIRPLKANSEVLKRLFRIYKKDNARFAKVRN